MDDTFPLLALEALTDPTRAAKMARVAAISRPLTPEDHAILRHILSPWWSTCQDAREMAWWVGAMGELTGLGSAAHRRAALIALLCARTVCHLVRQRHEEIEELLDRIEAWVRGYNLVDPLAVRDRLQELRDVTRYTATASTFDAAFYAASATTRVNIRAFTYNAVNSAAYAHRNLPLQLAELADLLRSAIPTCPLPDEAPDHAAE